MGHTHAAPTITNYFLQNFHNDFSNKTDERLIAWTGVSEQNTVRYYNQLLMPFSGALHKIFWRQAGTCDDTTIKVYQNLNDEAALISGATNNTPIFEDPNFVTNIGTGNGLLYGNMNERNFANLAFNTGDNLSISLQAKNNTIEEMMGQILYSQTVTI